MRSGQCMELVTGGSDMWIFIVFVCVTVTAIIIFVNYRRTKKTMDTIEEMLNVAVKGEFTEGQFDETRMSALETKFAHYLSASALSAQNVEAEKDKIKALICRHFPSDKNADANLLLYSEVLLEEELPQQIEGNVSAIHEQTPETKISDRVACEIITSGKWNFTACSSDGKATSNVRACSVGTETESRRKRITDKFT